MAFKLQGKLGNEVEVDSNNNVTVNLPTTLSQAGFAAVTAESDPGARTGSRLVRRAQITETGRTRAGADVLLFQDMFNAAPLAANPTPVTVYNYWNSTLSTMTELTGGGYLALNDGNSVATSAYANVRTYRTFPLYGTFQLYAELWAIYETGASAVQAKCTVELGLGFAATNAAPTDGAFFRWNSAGEFRCVVVNSSVELTSGVLTSPTVNRRHHFLVAVSADSVDFWIDGVLWYQQTLTTESMPTRSLNQPVFFREYNDASISPTAAVQLRVIGCTVSQGDMGITRPWPVIMAGLGNGIYQYPSGFSNNPALPVSTANWLNSVVPANSAALANATAGYGPTLLGGQFRFAAPAGAETDYVLFAYLITAGTAVIPGKNLYITGVTIDTWSEAVAVTTGPSVFQWYIGVGATQITLVTATDSAGVKCARRIPLGFQSLPVNAPIGQLASPTVSVQFPSPLFCDNGTYVHLVVKVIVGTATTSEFFRGLIGVYGFWE